MINNLKHTAHVLAKAADVENAKLQPRLAELEKARLRKKEIRGDIHVTTARIAKLKADGGKWTVDEIKRAEGMLSGLNSDLVRQEALICGIEKVCDDIEARRSRLTQDSDGMLAEAARLEEVSL